MTPFVTFKITQLAPLHYRIMYTDPEINQHYNFTWNLRERYCGENEQTANWLTYLCGKEGIHGVNALNLVTAVRETCQSMEDKKEQYLEYTVYREDIEH